MSCWGREIARPDEPVQQVARPGGDVFEFNRFDRVYVNLQQSQIAR